MNIALTGSSGLVGSALIPFLNSKGCTVTKIKRSTLQNLESAVEWVPEKGNWETASEDNLHGVIHLAGENIASGKWTEDKKSKILNSRVEGTRQLCKSILKLQKLPAVFVCASAIGYYGDRGDEILTEESSLGDCFLSHVCEKWEEETLVLSEAGIRVVNLRFSMILSSKGGALKKMLPPFKLGAGGKLGTGDQYMSWIVINDVLNAVHHVLTNDTLRGPVNTASPNPVTNNHFTKALGKALKRPTIIPMPAFLARIIFGQMADELLLSSTRVEPTKLKNSGFQFKYPDINTALSSVLQE